MTKPSLFCQKWSEMLSHRCETWRYFNTWRVGKGKEKEEIFNDTMKAWMKLVSDVPCLPCLPWRNKLEILVSNGKVLLLKSKLKVLTNNMKVIKLLNKNLFLDSTDQIILLYIILTLLFSRPIFMLQNENQEKIIKDRL